MRILGKLITELEALYAGVQMGARAYFRSVLVRPIKTLPSTPLPAQELDRLPSSYGRTCLVMLAIDPYTVHAYWEVTLENLAEARNRIPKVNKTAQPVLRFYYSGHASQDAGPFDVNVDLRSRNWYVPLWSAGKTYYVELGLKAQPEQFVLLARSNLVHTPRAWPESQVDECFMRVSEGRAEVVPTPVRRKLDPAQLAISTLSSDALPPDSVSPETTCSVESPGKQPEVHRLRKSRVKPPEREKADLIDLAEMAEKRLAAGFSSVLLHRPER
jgi:hypothetical protein